MALPKATQLMRHGFMQEVTSVARGDLPGGLEDSWLAQVAYAFEGRSEIERSPFTLVLVQAPASLGFVRVLCHDRGLSDRDSANPDSDREVVSLEDRAVRLESEDFTRRYRLSTDQDQDQLAVWQLFDPSLIDWLTHDAPPGLSFELQDGALACFRPGKTADAAELNGLCAAAATIFRHIEDIERQRRGSGVPPPGTRWESLELELSEHPFTNAPPSTKAAAKAFRRGPLLNDRAWKLGAEAFFRAHAGANGLERVEPSVYRADHLETFLPGKLAHVAFGRMPGTAADAFLVLTNDDDYDDMGWSNLVVEVASAFQGYAVAGALPRGDAAERGSIMAGSDGRSLILSSLDGGSRDRKQLELESFLASGRRILEGVSNHAENLRD